jgi:hypothetical protein
VSWSGANTLTEPHHILLAGDDPRYAGLAALEVVFHEASHTLLGPGSGAVSEALAAAGAKLGREIPRDLWHAVLFYSVGYEIKRVLAAAGHPSYEPHVYKQRLFERSWPSFREPLEQHWRPYLEGSTDLRAAAESLLAAIAVD